MIRSGPCSPGGFLRLWLPSDLAAVSFRGVLSAAAVCVREQQIGDGREKEDTQIKLSHIVVARKILYTPTATASHNWCYTTKQQATPDRDIQRISGVNKNNNKLDLYADNICRIWEHKFAYTS